MSAVDRPGVEPRTPALRFALGAAAAALAFVYFGPVFFGQFRPSEPGRDFSQEWLSARNFWTGAPVYSPQRDAMLRHSGLDTPYFEAEMKWNAHPPVAVLVALPFGLITDYAAAHLVWNCVTFFLFVLGFVLLARELGIDVRGGAAFWALALIVSWNAIHQHLFQGQLGFLIAFLLIVGWIADHRGHQTAAGIAVGIAAAMKVFPGLVLVYFVAAGRWRAVAVALLTGVLLHAVALALFGPAAFETYVRDVLPSLGRFQDSWLNVSFTGYWRRIGFALGAPAVGVAVAVACRLLAIVAIWWVGRSAVGADDRGRAFALAVVGMLLASPIAWTHYFVLLVIPLLFLWQRLPSGLARVALVAVTAVLWLPERLVPALYLGTEAVSGSSLDTMPNSVWMAVVVLGPFTYALAALFLLVGFARLTPVPVADRPN
ncbi:membrane protein : Putative conserved integral membrane protein OS=Planctomyces maris DSM 8797 GN=PM8797T_17824 PE=4 SV=1: DUF2029 [Gemmata massiliana]|uniref:DUF2029 domain-containing protein n=1 Tax=Gemmata massiliana TaxID=1210884 RepID=A0A6P2DKR5_9BACT|nr:glycosyltransferase family 87 protein [Gemmata massiliana]VTS01086.1 membrane protein : Putative conserved integral membrane protein OS=Planctomyces maris DSM 8797 GN=PM8797T_17824 PE=4 SV=1: DUF2029 [Gemmata massiliana]